MMPDPNSELAKTARYILLEYGDKILIGDEYYNPISDKWLAVMKEFIGEEWDSDTSKPVRRLNLRREAKQ